MITVYDPFQLRTDQQRTVNSGDQTQIADTDPDADTGSVHVTHSYYVLCFVNGLLLFQSVFILLSDGLHNFIWVEQQQ